MSVHHLPAPQTDRIDRIDRIEERLDVIVGLLHGLINEVHALRERLDAR